MDGFEPGRAQERLAEESARAIRGDAALGDVAAQLARIRALDEGKPRKTVTILGAGMAGLAAAYELEQLGHKVRILEGNDRVGGRVWTHRFEDGTYHELGAMRIPASHDHTRRYVELLGLELRPFITSHANPNGFYDVHGVTTRIKDARETLYPKFELSDEERDATTAPAIAGNVLAELLESLSAEETASLFSTELSSERLEALDRTSLGDYLAARLGQDALELSTLSDASESLLGVAVTEFLREDLRKIGEGLEEIVGGMDRLPAELAKRLEAEVELHTQVLGIHPREDGKVDLRVSRNGGEPSTETHDEVLCTLPFGVLRNLGVESEFSREKQKAIRNLSYEAAGKVLLHTRRRFWETDYGIQGGASHSDSVIRSTYYPSDSVGSPAENDTPGVLVGSYAWGQDARRLGALPPRERTETVIRHLARIHPEIAEPGMVDDSAVVAWEQYPFAAGGYAKHLPGQQALYAASLKPEGGVHFAGEHCSLDHGWIQGAIISALRAVEEIVTSAAASDAPALAAVG